MYDIFYNFISSKTILILGAWLGLPLFIILIIMFFIKKNRDERGWKIFGKASIITFIWLMIITNVIAKIVGNTYPAYALHYIEYANTIQWIFNSSIIVELISVIALRKIE